MDRQSSVHLLWASFETDFFSKFTGVNIKLQPIINTKRKLTCKRKLYGNQSSNIINHSKNTCLITSWLIQLCRNLIQPIQHRSKHFHRSFPTKSEVYGWSAPPKCVDFRRCQLCVLEALSIYLRIQGAQPHSFTTISRKSGLGLYKGVIKIP